MEIWDERLAEVRKRMRGEVDSPMTQRAMRVKRAMISSTARTTAARASSSASRRKIYAAWPRR